MITISERIRREHNRLYKAILRWQWKKAGMDAPIVLMVHGFQPSKQDCLSPFQLSTGSFESLITHFIHEGWHAMTYEELTRLTHQIVSQQEICKNDALKKRFYLTFDDVFDTVYTDALPILRKNQIPFTIFVTQNLIGKHNVSDNRLFLTEEHLCELAKEPLCTIGCHGVEHVQFKQYSEMEMTQACDDEKNWLKDKFDADANCFAFPYGRWQDVNKWNIDKLCDLGFHLGFSAIEGTLLSAKFSTLFFLPRVNVSETFVEKFISGISLDWKDCEGR